MAVLSVKNVTYASTFAGEKLCFWLREQKRWKAKVASCLFFLPPQPLGCLGVYGAQFANRSSGAMKGFLSGWVNPQSTNLLFIVSWGWKFNTKPLQLLPLYLSVVRISSSYCQLAGSLLCALNTQANQYAQWVPPARGWFGWQSSTFCFINLPRSLDGAV